MRQLSHADRAAILAMVDQLRSEEGDASDIEVIKAASDVLLTSRLRTGFEHALASDTLLLCNFLRTSEDDSVRKSARAALLYLVRRDDFWPDCSPEIGFQDDAYVLDLTLHEIERVTRTATVYDAPEPMIDERRVADLRLEHFVKHPLCSDNELLARAESFRQTVSHVSARGFFGRMCRQVEFLAAELLAPSSQESLAWARAGLSYLACPDDAIPDDLGVVGLIDEYYILDTVVGMLRARADPWLTLLNEAVQSWPFLKSLILSDNGSRVPFSEYLIANAALSMQPLRGHDVRQLSGIAMPAAGPVPVLAAFAAGLGLAQMAVQSGVTAAPFEPGQKVLVDGKTIAIFGGFEVSDGQRRFKLIQNRKCHGDRVQSVKLWPEHHLSRLRPADRSRATRGPLVFDASRNTAPVSAVDRLLHSENPIQFGDSAHRVLLISPASECQSLTNELSVFGEKLHDVIPWGHIDLHGEAETWSRRWGCTQPVVLVVSSLDKAREYLDGLESHQFSLILVQGQGSISRQAVSLRGLSRAGIPMCVFTRERDQADLELLDNAGFDLFEWETDDIRELTWHRIDEDAHTSVIRSYERRVLTSATGTPEVQQITLPAAMRVFELLRGARRLSARREQPLRELDAFVATSQKLMHRLLQSVVPISDCQPLNTEVTRHVVVLSTLVSSTLYLSHEERDLCEGLIRAFRGLADSLCEYNPKATAVAELLRKEPELTIVCHDTTAAQHASAYWAGKTGSAQFSVLPCPADTEEALPGRVVIAGWLGARRMPFLLQPPICEKMTLLLYEVESNWHNGFRRACDRARRDRGARSKRERFLGPKAKRPAPDVPESSNADEENTFAELVAIDEATASYHRHYVVDSARAVGSDEPEVEVRVFWFAGGSHAFLTDTYKAKSVTRLLDGTLSAEQAEKATVRMLPRDEVGVGERLLFYRGSDGDAIRVVADQLLGAPERRRAAGLWRDALRRFRARNGLSIMEVWRRLKEAGCTHQPLTVNHWLEDDDMIGPRDAHDHELRIIAEVTQDRELLARMEECNEAIRDVWGAHLAASDRLAKMVLTRMARKLAIRRDAPMELESSVVVVEVAEVDRATVRVRRSFSNRLLED